MGPPDLARARWQRRFWTTLVGVLAITLSYPIAILWVLHSDAFGYIRNDLAWSFHSVFFVPIAFGLLATAFNRTFFISVDIWERIIWISVLLILVVPLSWGVLVDQQLIPTPDRLGPDLQPEAARIDQCLRTKTCQDKFLADNNNNTCSEDVRYAKIFNLDNFVQAQLDSKSLRLTRSYYCSLLTKIGDREIPMGPMNAIILGLKIILILLVWLFLWYTLFLAFHSFNSIDLRTLYTLIGCYIILVSWFPLQLYAEWYQWYGDLSHVLLYYTFWVLLVVALLLIALFAIWVVVLVEKANLITAVAALQSIVITVFGALFYFKPEAVDKMFGVFERLPSPLVIVLMFILLLYIAIYVHLILVFSTGNAVFPARPDRR